jgi:WD40 repeat protein
MRQINVGPAGCEVHAGRSWIYIDEEVLYYTSTLAIYVFDVKTFNLQKVIPVSDRSIQSMSVCSVKTNLVAVSTMDGAYMIWDLETEWLINKVALPIQSSRNVTIYWDMTSAKDCMIIHHGPVLRFINWDTKVPNAGGLNEVFAFKNPDFFVTKAAFHPHQRGVIAVGCSNGTTMVLHSDPRSKKLLKAPNRTSSVVEVKWDRLSSIYLLVAYQNVIALWDADTEQEIHVTDFSMSPVTSVAWLEWAAGNFISSSPKGGGLLRIWNASQKAPLETIRVCESSITAVHVAQGSRRVLCACTDGSVVVYNLQKGSCEFRTSAGHTETIFDCQFSPASPDVFATTGYDATVKIWNAVDLTLVSTLHGEGSHYCCCWSPEGDMIAVGTSDGLVILFGTSAGREVLRLAHHTKNVYRVAWNASERRVIASSGADAQVVVFEIDPHAALAPEGDGGARLGSKAKAPSKTKAESESNCTVRFRIKHPQPVFGISWCPYSAMMLATACGDGIVRIFDCTFDDGSAPSAADPTAIMLYELKGHTARAFNVAWSPISRGILASTSDDKSVLLWNISPGMSNDELNRAERHSIVGPYMTLTGHTDNVRAVTFNYEHKQLLVTGSWDATIRLWDIVNGTCLKVVSAHAADVYAIASHPQRPFTLVSCSRDTTVRVWEMQEVFQLLRNAAILDGDLSRILSGKLTDELGPHSCMLMPELCGMKSVILNQGKLASGSRGGDAKNGSTNGLRAGAEGERRDSADFMQKSIAAAERFKAISDFFSGSSGAKDVWDALIVYLSKRTTAQQSSQKTVNASSSSLRSASRLLLHQDEIIDACLSEAKKLESTRMGMRRGEAMSNKTIAQLQEAAYMYARAGEIKMYCKIMADIGNWTDALAVAPSVSLEYWQSLTKAYTQQLLSQSSEKAVPHLLGIGRNEDVIEFYLQRRELRSAFVVAKVAEKRETRPSTSPRPSYRDDSSRSIENLMNDSMKTIHDSSDSIATQNTESRNGAKGNWSSASRRSDVSARSLVRAVARHGALMHLQASNPLLAAAQYIMVDEPESAVSLLMACGHPDIGFAIAKCTGGLENSHYVTLAYHIARQHGALPLALGILENVPSEEAEVHKGLLIVRHAASPSEHTRLYEQFSVRPTQAWERRGESEETVGSEAAAVISFVLAGQFARAVRKALAILGRHTRGATDIDSEMTAMLHALKAVNAMSLEPGLRHTFMCRMLWYTAHEAAELGLMETGWCMLRILRDSDIKASMDISDEEMHIQVGHDLVKCNMYCTQIERRNLNILRCSFSTYHKQEMVFRIAGGDRDVTLLIGKILNMKNLDHEVRPRSWVLGVYVSVLD